MILTLTYTAIALLSLALGIAWDWRKRREFDALIWSLYALVAILWPAVLIVVLGLTALALAFGISDTQKDPGPADRYSA